MSSLQAAQGQLEAQLKEAQEETQRNKALAEDAQELARTAQEQLKLSQQEASLLRGQACLSPLRPTCHCARLMLLRGQVPLTAQSEP